MTPENKEVEFGSLFSGIGGFDLGLERAGMRCIWQVERDIACNILLKNRFVDAKRFDDVRRVRSYLEPRNAGRNTTRIVRPEWICGGFPCQDVSVAGRRAGLAGSRSGLWFEFRRIIALLRPTGVLIENVPGLLSSNGGRDLGAILWSLGQLGYGWAFRVLDSQYFGVPQRRRRVFIVGCFGDMRRAAKILFESDCLPWHSPPRKEAGARVAGTIAAGAHPGGFDADANCAGGHDASEDGTGRGTPLIPVYSIQERASSIDGGPCGLGIRQDISYTLEARHHVQAVAFDLRQITSKENRSNPAPGDPCHTLHRQASGIVCQEVASMLCAAYAKGGHNDGKKGSPQNLIASRLSVRRLTPLEYCRLQGFPDDWLDGLGFSDSAKYRMLGNAVTAPVAEWIGRRILRTGDGK